MENAPVDMYELLTWPCLFLAYYLLTLVVKAPNKMNK